jgi:MSHA biogenesis protein MshN
LSVINKMLRDLDNRQDTESPQDPTQKSRTGLASKIVVVSDSAETGRKRGSLYLGMVLIIVLAGAAGARWYTSQNVSLLHKPEQATLVVQPAINPPPISPVPRAETVVTLSPLPAIIDSDNLQPEAVIEKSTVVAEASSPNRTPRSDATGEPPAAPDQPTTERPATLAPVTVVEKLLTEASSPKSDATGTQLAAPEGPIAESPPTIVPTTPTPAMAAPKISQRRSPALDALAQAQSLWGAGSRQASMNLLRKALAATERANPVRTPSGNHSELVLLAREMARMDLLEGRASSALEMLTRLEPALSGYADIWAIRGNAAQRLGRHQESAEAYLMALELRPSEPRWMLGAAVSLAVQGRTVNAAELAEKARTEGVLTPEVSTYLRKLGVPLRDR